MAFPSLMDGGAFNPAQSFGQRPISLLPAGYQPARISFDQLSPHLMASLGPSKYQDLLRYLGSSFQQMGQGQDQGAPPLPQQQGMHNNFLGQLLASL